MKETQREKRKPNVRWDTRVVDSKTIWFPIQNDPNETHINKIEKNNIYGKK